MIERAILPLVRRQQLAPARQNFAIVLVELQQADWFYLSNDGHRRAIIDLHSGEGCWVAP